MHFIDFLINLTVYIPNHLSIHLHDDMSAIISLGNQSWNETAIAAEI